MIRRMSRRWQDGRPGLRRGLVAAAVLALALSGCGGASPSAGCGLGGTADASAFARTFTALDLVDSAGNPGAQDPDAGTVFGANDRLVVRAEVIAAADVRLCVAVRDASGAIVADRTEHLAAGVSQIDLGTFSARGYVVRVGVGGVLVRSLAFATR